MHDPTTNPITRPERGWPAGGPLWRQIAVAAARVGAQIVVFILLFQAYKLVRKSFIQRAQDVAFDNALQIIRWQQALAINIELDLQQATLEHDWLIWFFNRYYAYFQWALYACVALCMLLNPPAFRRLRRVFLLTMVLALPWYAIYPLAPPRFMQPYGWAFVDTLAVYGPNYFSETGAVQANRFAAMPSMHIGWTVIAGLMLAAAVPWRRLGPTLGALHIALMCVTVVVTGNHYILDIAGGLAIVVAAFVVARVLPADLRVWRWRRGAEPGASPRSLPTASP